MHSRGKTIKKEELIDIFNSVKSKGEFEYEEETDTRRLKLDDDLYLVLKIKDTYHNLYIQRNLPDDAIVMYYNDSTWIETDKYCATNVAIEDKLITFNSKRDQIKGLKDLKILKAVKKIGTSERAKDGARYRAKYQYKNLLPLNLQKYTNDESIVKYFEMNDLVQKS